MVCASPKYLARYGRPVHPSDLTRHACLTLSHFPGANRWPFRIDGQLTQVEVKGPVAADSAHMLLKLAIAGTRIIRFGDNVVASAVQQALLEPLLKDLQEPESFPLWAMLPPGRQRTPKVRVFLDFLGERFGPAPWRLKR